MTMYFLCLFWSHFNLTKIREEVVLLFPLYKEAMNNYSKSLLSESNVGFPPQVTCVFLTHLMYTEHLSGATVLGTKSTDRHGTWIFTWKEI